MPAGKGIRKSAKGKKPIASAKSKGYVLPTDTKSKNPSEHELDDFLEKLKLDDTSAKGPEPNIRECYQTSPRWVQPDPTIILKGPSHVKHLDITDFINLVYYEEPRVGTDGSAADILEAVVKAKSGPAKPRLSDVSIPDWNYANVRIMDELFEVGDPALRCYWAYTAHINLFFRAHDRLRVLEFDRAYRIKQAQYGFPWGTDINWLVTEFKLGESIPVNTSESVSQQHQRVSKRPASARAPPGSNPDTCGNYNGYKGCQFGSKCIYQHRCRMCNGAHPQFVHRNIDNSHQGQGQAQSSPTTAWPHSGPPNRGSR